jgi:hypothetical protein
MALVGIAPAGRPIVPATGSIQTVLPRSGILLGIFANATGTCVLYDAAAAATPGTALCTLTLLAGWNPVPMEFVNGICANCSTTQVLICG